MDQPIATEPVVVDTVWPDLLPADAAPEVLFADCAFTEGPVWFGDMRCLLWSDIPNDRLMRWTPDGRSACADSPEVANGNTRTCRAAW